MKKMKVLAICAIAMFSTTSIKAGDFTVATDVVSSYVFRGVQYSGASFQPTLDYTIGGLSIGSWGSAGLDGFLEMDLYAKYAFDFGLSLGVTSYYYPGSNYFDISKATGSHGLEANLGYSLGELSIAANYIFNEAGSAGTKGGDMYYELAYDFEKFSIFAGAGSGWHSPTGDFKLVNVGISSTKEIKITDTFSVPVKASAILNPTTEQFYLVAAFTL